MLVTSIFSISYSVFQSLLLQGRYKSRLCGKGLKPFPNKPWFLRVYRTSLLKTLWEKDKFDLNWNSYLATLSVRKSPKFVIWERVNVTAKHKGPMLSTQSDNCAPFVYIFYIIFLFAVELGEPKTGIWGTGLMTNYCLSYLCRETAHSTLTHSHSKTPFDAPEKQAFWKHCGERRNCL